MSGGFVECRLDLIDPGQVQYSDTRHPTPVTEPLRSPDLATATIDWLGGLVEADETAVAGEGLRLLGRHLYESVFVGRIDTVFRETFAGFGAGTDRARGLRLVISFHARAEALARRPWEFLYLAEADGGRGTFLAGERRSLVLTRTVAAARRSASARPTSGRTSVLLALSTPPGSVLGTTEKLTRLLAGPVAGRSLATTTLQDPTYDDVAREIAQRRPDVVHIIGHGTPGQVLMRRDPVEREDEEAANWVAASGRRPPEPAPGIVAIDARKVSALFATHTPRVVFLQTCHGGAATAGALDATAVDVVHTGVPAVVAMQYDIHADRADLFASTFYGALLLGKTIGEAAGEGRRALAAGESSLWDRRDFAIPVVYVHEDTEVVQAPADPPAATRAARHPCPRCGASVAHRMCGQCGLLLRCPCGWDGSVDCDCRELLEHPVGGRFCGACTHRLPAPAAAEGAEAPALRSIPPVSRDDGFAGAR